MLWNRCPPQKLYHDPSSSVGEFWSSHVVANSPSRHPGSHTHWKLGSCVLDCLSAIRPALGVLHWVGAAPDRQKGCVVCFGGHRPGVHQRMCWNRLSGKPQNKCFPILPVTPGQLCTATTWELEFFKVAHTSSNITLPPPPFLPTSVHPPKHCWEFRLRMKSKKAFLFCCVTLPSYWVSLGIHFYTWEM